MTIITIIIVNNNINRDNEGMTTQYEYLERECVVPPLIYLIKKHCADDVLAEWGCKCVAGMAKDLRLRALLVEHGACEVVVSTLNRGTGSGE